MPLQFHSASSTLCYEALIVARVPWCRAMAGDRCRGVVRAHALSELGMGWLLLDGEPDIGSYRHPAGHRRAPNPAELAVVAGNRAVGHCPDCVGLRGTDPLGADATPLAMCDYVASAVDAKNS